MYEIELVPERVKKSEYAPRVNTITVEDRSAQEGNIFFITTDPLATDNKTYTIGITDIEQNIVNASLHYEIVSPPYSTMYQKYSDLAGSCNAKINSIKEEFQDTEYRWEYEKPERTSTDEAGLEIIDDFNKYFVTQKVITTERELSEEALDEVKYLEQTRDEYQATANEWKEKGAEFNEKFGYGILLTVTTGAIGCDVKYLRLNSSRGVKITVIVVPHLASNKVMNYRLYDEDLDAESFLEEKNTFEKENFNQNYLSNQTYHVIDTVTEPDIYYWIEVSIDGKRWLRAQGTEVSTSEKSASVNGVLTGTVQSIESIDDPNEELDRAQITVIDESGGTHTSEVTDYSNISVGDTINMGKLGNSLTYTSDNKKVKIDNGKGTNYTNLNTVLWGSIG